MTDRTGHIGGSLSSAGGKEVVRIDGRLDHDAVRVWSALTEPAALAAWYGEIEGELRPGGEFHARLHASGWEGTRRIEVCEPRRRLLTVPTDPSEPDSDTTEVTLAADGGATTFVVEQHGLPLDLAWAYGAGLQIHVEDLARYLAGHGRVDSRTRFAELEPHYKELAASLDGSQVR